VDKNLVYLRVAANEKAIYARSLDGTKDQRVVASDSKAEYSAGHLLFMRGAVLTATPFDLAQLATTGEGAPLADDVGLTATTGFAAFAVSENGTLSYRTSSIGNSQLTWAIAVVVRSERLVSLDRSCSCRCRTTIGVSPCSTAPVFARRS
jgi:hypothetical protein